MGVDVVAEGNVESGGVNVQRSFANAADNSPVVGKIIAGENITLARSGPNGTTISYPGNVGDNVYASETLTTGDNGRGRIAVNDGSQLQFGPNSTMGLKALETKVPDTSSRGSIFNVINGAIPASAGPPREAPPRTTILGVRG